MKNKDFILKIIRIRKMLINTNKSMKNKLSVIRDVAFFENHLAANHYSVKTMALFFVRHQDKLLNIIPGKTCKSHQKLMNEFNLNLTLSQNLL